MSGERRLSGKAFRAPLLAVLFVAGTACLLFAAVSISSRPGRIVLEAEEDPLDKIADNAIAIKKRLEEAGKPFLAKDKLDQAVNAISANGAAPSRWNHLDPQELDKKRSDEWSKAAGSLSTPSAPVGHTAYSPSDHLAAQAGKWLTKDATKAQIANQARKVLPQYESDLSKKPAMEWSKVGPLKLNPVGSSVEEPSSKVIKQLRDRMENVKQGVYGGEPIPVWGQTENKQPANPTNGHVLAHSNEGSNYYWMQYPSKYPPYFGDYDNARDYYAHLSHGQGSHSYNFNPYQPSDAAVQAYVNSIQHTPSQAWTNAIGAYVAGKQHLENAHRRFPVDQADLDRNNNKVIRIRFQRNVHPAAEEEEQTEHTADSTRGARVDRIETEDAMPAHSHDDPHEHEHEESEAPHKSVEEQVEAAVHPLEQRIEEEAKKIARMQGSVDHLHSHHHAPHHHAHADVSEPHFSVSVPGEITMDHVSLPGGEYSFSFSAGAAAAAAPVEHHAQAAPTHETEHAAAPPHHEEAEDDVLDSHNEMDNGVDREAVKAAAKELQKKVVNKAESAKGSDGVLNSRTEMDNSVDKAAQKKAAEDLRKKLVEAHESSTKADTSVLDSASDMHNGVDKAAVKEAADAIQREVVKQAGLRAEISAKLHSKDMQTAIATREKEAAQWKRAAKQGKNGPKALRGRTQMLTDSMLMPIQIEPDVSDFYNDPQGATAYREEVRRRQPGNEKEYGEHYRHMDDQYNYAVQRPPVSFAGGVGSAAHTLPPGGEQGAWYSNWWRNPNVGDIESALEKDLGVEDEGKQRLIQEGVNVNGWEPGRTRDQVRRDHLEGKQMPGGFWEDDGKSAGQPDTEVHLPCEHPARKQPCTQEEKAEEEAEAGARAQASSEEEEGEEGGEQQEGEEEEGKEPLWKDPMPLKTLKAEYEAREAAGDAGEAEQGGEEEPAEEEQEEEENGEGNEEEGADGAEEEEPIWKDPMPLKQLKQEAKAREEAEEHHNEEGEEGEEGAEEEAASER